MDVDFKQARDYLNSIKSKSRFANAIRLIQILVNFWWHVTFPNLCEIEDPLKNWI